MKTHIKIALISLVLGFILVFTGILLGADLNFNGLDSDFTSKTITGNFSDINSIHVDLSAYNVEISPSKNRDITVEYSNIERNGEVISKLDLKIDNGTLNIKEDTLGKVSSKFKFPFGANFFKGHTVKIKVPKEIAEKFNLNINLNMGSLTVLNSSLNRSNIDLELGSIELIESKIKDSKITCNMGSIETRDSQLENTNIKTDMGSIEHKGTLLGDNELSSNMGSIDLKLNQRRETLGISTNVDMGSVELNGRETNLQDDKSKYNNFLKINANMGSVEIEFNE